MISLTETMTRISMELRLERQNADPGHDVILVYLQKAYGRPAGLLRLSSRS